MVKRKVDASGEENNDYEQMRNDNIKRNQEFLASLGLDNVKNSLEESKPKKVASKRGVNKKSGALKAPQVPTRRSGRVTLDKVKIELEELKKSNKKGNEKAIAEKEAQMLELEEKKKSLVFNPIEENATSTMMYEQKDRKGSDVIMKISEPYNVDQEDGSSGGIPLLQMLKNLNIKKDFISANKSVTCSSSSSSSSKGNWRDDYSKRLKALTVKEEGVAKIVENRLTSVMVHPCTSKTIVAGGDKSGNFGIWDVDMASKGGIDGVYRYEPFVAPVESIHSRSYDDYKVYIGSRDGTVRSLDLNKDQFDLTFCAPESIYDVAFNSFDFKTHGRLQGNILVGRGDGDIAVLDPRKPKGYATTADIGGNSKINSIIQHPVIDHLVACTFSGRDGSVHMCDVRKSYKSIYALTVADSPSKNENYHLHSKSINAAHISYDGSCIVSVSQDNTVKATALNPSDGSLVMKSTGKPSIITLRHDNHTGRWLSTFHPTFDPKCPSAFLLGSMDRPRKFQVWSPSSTFASIECVATYKNDHIGAVSSRFAFHPTQDILCGGNSSGRCYLIRK